jgi:hypothetical protein
LNLGWCDQSNFCAFQNYHGKSLMELDRTPNLEESRGCLVLEGMRFLLITLGALSMLGD